MSAPDKKPGAGDVGGASDEPRGLVPPLERSEAYGPVVDRDMDRDTGEGVAPATADEAAERERPLSDGGMEQAVDPLAGDVRTGDADPSGSRS